MITPAYSATATERVLPRLALDFTTGTLDPRVSVTRALNTATRVNSSGFIETVNANLPRFDYDPTTLVAKGLLIEEQRTNQIIYSNDFRTTEEVGTTRDWVIAVGSSVVTTNYATSPDGTTNANLMSIPSNFYSGRQQNFTATAGVAYTFSFWIKRLSGGTSGSLQIFGAGIISASTAFTSTANWQRITVTGTASATGLAGVYIYPDYTGSGSSEYLLYGAQLEVGAFPTSYVPTTTTSVTRNADVVSMTGTNFSDWYNAGSGAILARSRQSVITGTRPSIYISDGTANNIISLRGLAANPELYIKATTDQAQIDAGTLTANSSFGLVGAWTTDNCAAAINGGAAVTDTSATIPTVDQMLIGSDGTNYLNGQVERISYWPQRIINAEAQAFSK